MDISAAATDEAIRGGTGRFVDATRERGDARHDALRTAIGSGHHPDVRYIRVRRIHLESRSNLGVSNLGGTSSKARHGRLEGRALLVRAVRGHAIDDRGDGTERLGRLSQLGHGRARTSACRRADRDRDLVLHREWHIQRPVPLGRAGTGGADVGDVAVGPTVDDLVAALRANENYTSTAPSPVTIDGYAGQELELQLPDDPFTKCDNEAGDDSGHAFVFAGPGLSAQGPANRWHLYILDVDGTRLIAVILSYAKTPQADLDLARHIIETLDIT